VKSWLLAALLGFLSLLSPALPAQAQELSVSYAPGPRDVEPELPEQLKVRRDPEATWSDVHGARSFGLFAAGALTGFFAHEGGHLLANLVMGNVPQIQPIWGFGFIPFFTIAPRIGCYGDTCYKHDGSEFWAGPRGKFAITSAGFNVQHITDEILLTRTPYLRYRVAPFQKGLLAFNVLLSIGYATAAITRIENPQGDLSRSAELIGMPPEVYAAMLLLPAGLDIYRYFRPDSRWAPWVSRGGKLAVFGLTFTL
jgi:hypothetical protein